jgi:hypothetical protein
MMTRWGGRRARWLLWPPPRTQGASSRYGPPSGTGAISLVGAAVRSSGPQRLESTTISRDASRPFHNLRLRRRAGVRMWREPTPSAGNSTHSIREGRECSTGRSPLTGSCCLYPRTALASGVSSTGPIGGPHCGATRDRRRVQRRAKHDLRPADQQTVPFRGVELSRRGRRGAGQHP